jgi:hypothetical protein
MKVRTDERICDLRLPYDEQAERHAIGALLLAPDGWQRRLSYRLHFGHFFSQSDAWLWEQVGMALKYDNMRFDHTDASLRWMRNVQPVFRRRFGLRVSSELAKCVRNCFWWNADWYVDRVLQAARLRTQVIKAAGVLHRVLDTTDQWWTER